MCICIYETNTLVFAPISTRFFKKECTFKSRNRVWEENKLLSPSLPPPCQFVVSIVCKMYRYVFMYMTLWVNNYCCFYKFALIFLHRIYVLTEKQDLLKISPTPLPVLRECSTVFISSTFIQCAYKYIHIYMFFIIKSLHLVYFWENFIKLHMCVTQETEDVCWEKK